jgi:hypothetical protein
MLACHMHNGCSMRVFCVILVALSMICASPCARNSVYLAILDKYSEEVLLWRNVLTCAAAARVHCSTYAELYY